MPQKYTDADGNEVELLTKEEQQAEIDKKVAEATAAKVPPVVEKKEDAKTVPSIEDIDKELAAIKQTFQAKELADKESWFNEQVGSLLESEEDKKKVRQYFDVLEKKEGVDKKSALADALTLVTRKNISPFNGVTNYNQNSFVPGSEKEGDDIKKLAQKFNSNLPPGFKMKK